MIDYVSSSVFYGVARKFSGQDTHSPKTIFKITHPQSLKDGAIDVTWISPYPQELPINLKTCRYSDSTRWSIIMFV